MVKFRNNNLIKWSSFLGLSTWTLCAYSICPNIDVLQNNLVLTQTSGAPNLWTTSQPDQNNIYWGTYSQDIKNSPLLLSFYGTKVMLDEQSQKGPVICQYNALNSNQIINFFPNLSNTPWTGTHPLVKITDKTKWVTPTPLSDGYYGCISTDPDQCSVIAQY